MSLNLFPLIIKLSDFIGEDTERKRLFDELLGINKLPSDVCRPIYCTFSKIDRVGKRGCSVGCNPEKKEYCEKHSNEKYRQKPNQ